MRIIESIQLEIAAADPKIKQGFRFLESLPLTAVAYQKLAEQSPVLPLVNRQLSRLSRELHRSLRLYLEIHGPLTPVQPQDITEQNKPISESEPESAPATQPVPQPQRPTIAALFRNCLPPQPEIPQQTSEPVAPRCFTALTC